MRAATPRPLRGGTTTAELPCLLSAIWEREYQMTGSSSCQLSHPQIWNSTRLLGTTEKFWNVWERPSSCDGALFRPKSSGNSSNTRPASPTSGRQPRQRGRSRGFCITIRTTAIRRRVGSYCDAGRRLSASIKGERRFGRKGYTWRRKNDLQPWRPPVAPYARER